MQRHSKPAFGRELQSAADEITNDVGVTNEDCVRVVDLLRRCSIEMRSERRLDARSVLEELLKVRKDFEHQHCSIFSISYRVFRPPVPDLWNRWNRSSFFEQRIVSDRESFLVGQLTENNLSGLLRSRHCRDDELGDWQLELRQSLAGELRLLSSLLG